MTISHHNWGAANSSRERPKTNGRTSNRFSVSHNENSSVWFFGLGPSSSLALLHHLCDRKEILFLRRRDRCVYRRLTRREIMRRGPFLILLLGRKTRGQCAYRPAAIVASKILSNNLFELNSLNCPYFHVSVATIHNIFTPIPSIPPIMSEWALDQRARCATPLVKNQKTKVARANHHFCWGEVTIINPCETLAGPKRRWKGRELQFVWNSIKHCWIYTVPNIIPCSFTSRGSSYKMFENLLLEWHFSRICH